MFKIDFDPTIKENIEKSFSQTWTNDKVKMKTGKDKEDYYVLSNGETYEVDELVVGLNEIREWKLKNNLNI
jgi:ribonucleotide reductase beta subunit family protein with ferritin-like domain